MKATARSYNAVARRLESWRCGDGNWRLKGLLYALADGVDAPTVGHAWPRHRPVSPRDYVHLGARHDDTYEHSLSRELYDADAVRAGELVPRDEYISRALVSGTGADKDVLWREELLSTVQKGADIRRVARDAATVHADVAKKGDIFVEAETPFAATGAEGAGPEFNEADTKTEAYDCEKHEQGFAVTDELVDFGDVDTIEYNIRRAGEAVENAINRQAINELLDNATDYDANISGSGNTDTRDLLMKASEAAADNDFDPTDTLVMHPEYASELFGNNQLASMNGVVSDQVEDQDDSTLGHRLFIQSGTAYDSDSVTYGFEADGERGALVYGRQFVHLPVHRDVSVTELQPPFTAIHDLQGGVASAWTDVVAVDKDDDGTYESVVRVQR